MEAHFLYDFSFSDALDSLTSPANKFEKCSNQTLWHPPSTDNYKGAVDTSVTYKYQDPKTYKGPVVPGWEPGDSFLG